MLLKQIRSPTFMEADSKLDGGIEQEWKQFVARNPSIMKNMRLPYLMDITTSFSSLLCNMQVQDSALVTRLQFEQPTQVASADEHKFDCLWACSSPSHPSA
uniref:Calcineurin B-like protein n=1 Tax=Opuntia streptacantha TaxID=393608 RepID=A0A7C8ZKX9_OPUST